MNRFSSDPMAGGQPLDGALVQTLSHLVQARVDGARALGLADVFGVLEASIAQIGVELRRELAAVLAQRDDCPPGLMRFLANDEIDVARPVIVASPLLQERDLLEIAEHRSLEHRLVLAQRPHLPARVAEAIVGADEEGPIVALLNNPSTAIRRHALAYLVEQARRRTAFQQPLLNRAELTPDLALKLATYAVAGLRTAIMVQFQIDKATIDEAIRQAEQALNAGLVGLMDDWGKADELAAALIREKRLDVHSLSGLLASGEAALFLAGFRYYTQLPKLTVHRIVYEPGAKALAVVCRAIGMTREGFIELHRALAPARLGDPAMIATESAMAVRLFDQAAADKAKMLLARLQRDEEASVAGAGMSMGVTH